MIELIPAIDIIDGQCVRLTQGDYSQKTVYGSPLDMSKQFEHIGFKRLHVVDLDGAKSRHIVNNAVLHEITTLTKLAVDFGGGIKTDEDLQVAFDNGAQMVTVGSIAVTHPDLFLGWVSQYTLSGPAIELYTRVMQAYPELHLIASGGVSSIEDIKSLDAAGIPAVVFGKAIYEGKINLQELWDWQNA